VHEAAPGHFARPGAPARAHRIRRLLQSSAFIEGWAHYAEEMCVEYRGSAG
jgi:uncharacterized protein (DUF885 family)